MGTPRLLSEMLTDLPVAAAVVVAVVVVSGSGRHRACSPTHPPDPARPGPERPVQEGR